MRFRRIIAFTLLTALVATGVAYGDNPEVNEELERVVCYQFAQMYGLERPRYQVTLKRGREGLQRLAEKSWEKMTVRPLSKSQPKGLFPIMVEARSADEIVYRTQATIHITRFDSTLIAKQHIEKGQALDSTMLKVAWVETTQLYEQPLPTGFDATGWQSKRNLKPSALITREAIERIPDIRRGDEVTITVSKGLVRISAQGSALQDGAVGQTIKVRPADSRKILKVIVVGPGAVAIPGGKT